MKKIVSVAFAFVIFLTLIPFDAFAFSEVGVLRGVSGYNSRTGLYSGQYTDGSHSTYGHQIYPTNAYVNFTLPTVRVIDRIRIDASDTSALYQIRFYDDSGVEIWRSINYAGTNGTTGRTINIEPAVTNVKSIRVVAMDADRINLDEIDAYSPDTTPPPVPSGLNGTASNGQTALTWLPVSDSGLAGYFVYVDGVKVNDTPITGTSYTATGLTNNEDHTFQVSAIDTYGNESARSAAITRRFDVIPDPPVITASTVSGSATLSWSSVPGATGYNVYRNGVRITTIPIPDTSYTTPIVDNVSYVFRVTAVSGAVESAPSNALTVTYDTIPPSQPVGVFGTPQYAAARLEWLMNPSSEGVTGYNIYRDGVKITAAPITGTSYTAVATPEVAYSYTVTAKDAAGNESVPSDPVAIAALIPPDTVPPAMPTGLSASGQVGYVRLTWNANSESDIRGYYIYRNGIRINNDPITTTNFNVMGGMTFGTSYNFRISAVDWSGNESPRTPVESAAATKPIDMTPPDIPGGFTGTISPDALKIVLSWAASPAPDLAGYYLYISANGMDFTKLNATPLTGISFDYQPIEGDTLYYFRLSAIDEDGNESGKTKVLSIKTPKRDPDETNEPGAGAKLLVNWSEIMGAVSYLIYYNGNLVATAPADVTSFELTEAHGYDPDNATHIVDVKARFLDGSIGSDPPKKPNTNWGFTASDIWRAAVWIVGSLAAFVLLGLSIMLAPRIISLIRSAALTLYRKERHK